MKKIKMRLPVLVSLMLVGVFVFGAASGAFAYATGKQVAITPFMQMVSHTEYRFSEPGQIIARIVDYKGDSIAVTSCNVTILYPDKTIYVNMAGMASSVNISSDYYYSFTTPAGPEGTYEYQATCFYGVGKNASVTNSFHLSSAFNTINGNLSSINGNLSMINSNISLMQTKLNGVAGNLTELSTQLSAVNTSLSTQISDLSTQLNTNISDLIVSMDGNFTAVRDQLNANISTVLSELAAVNASISEAIARITSALTLRCFATHRVENVVDIQALSESLDTLIGIRDRLRITIRPYMRFHGVDEADIDDWIAEAKELEEGAIWMT